MIPTYEQMGDWLEEIVGEFPDAFFEELDGGIQLEEAALPDPDFPPGEMYIMGEYCHDMLGRYIVLYYGSFAALAEREDWGQETWEDELYTTLSHELTHHMEGRGGLHALDDKDAEFLRQAREIYGDT
mgnify:CR=1 FL=1